MSSLVMPTWPVLNDQAIRVVNELRNSALKAKVDFNAVRFFADAGYARHCLAACQRSSKPELSALAQRARLALFEGVSVVPALGPAANEPVVSERRPSSDVADEFARFSAAREMMNNLAVDACGLRSLLYVLKLERTSRCADLLPLLPPLQHMIARRMGAPAARLLVEQVRTRLL